MTGALLTWPWNIEYCDWMPWRLISAERRACSSAVLMLDCSSSMVAVSVFTCGASSLAAFSRGPVGQTDVGGDDVVLVLGVVDIVAQVVEHLHLGVGLRQAGRELVGHLDRLGGVGERGDTAGALDALNLAVAETQLLVDLRHAVVDELLGAQGYLVLVGIGLAVVADGQLRAFWSLSDSSAMEVIFDVGATVKRFR